ncbi:MAG: glycosyltransferase family 4 protein [Candidatus Uhrbacteria bacterium]
MRRILLLTLDFPPRRGGVARYLYGLAQYWKDQVFVVATPESGCQEFDSDSPFKIHRHQLLFAKFWPRWLPSIFYAFKYAKQYDTLWVSHILPLGTVAYFISLVLRKDYFIFLHSMDFALATRNGWKRWLTQQILNRATLVVTNSVALESRVKEFSKNPIKTLVVYPFVNLDMIRANVQPRLATNIVGESEDKEKVILLTVGRLVGRKGHHQVLKALAGLARSGSNQIQYNIVGSGLEYSALIKHVQKLGIVPLVRFFQNVSDQDLPQMYAQADIFIMPTETKGPDMEGFGIVYLEAGLSGLPVIGSKLPGVDEAVIHGKTGILVEAGNTDRLAVAIKYLVDNPEARKMFGQAGRQRVIDQFCCDDQAKKLTPFM